MLQLIEWVLNRESMPVCDRVIIEKLIEKRESWIQLMFKVCTLKDRQDIFSALNCREGILLSRCVAISLRPSKCAG